MQEPHQSLAESPPKNIVIFGESGVGKSSLVNQITGQPKAPTSNNAKGCTFQHQRYEYRSNDGTVYAIWDTSGLDEGTCGTVPAKAAMKNLKHLLRELFKADGVHLLVYCIRGSRLRRTSFTNYDLFYSAICRKKVPIVAVVTNLENHEEEMEEWWTRGQPEFAKLKMCFDGHACVTTLDANQADSLKVKQRCHASRRAVLDLIIGTCAANGWGADSDSWISTALVDVLARFRQSRNDSRQQPTPVVTLCDVSGHPPGIGNGSAVMSKNASPPPYLVDVCGSPFLVQNVCGLQSKDVGSLFKKRVSSRRADLLIFCTSLQTEHVSMARRRATEFYRWFDGDTRPFIVVVKDAQSDEAASEWWNASGDGSGNHHGNDEDVHEERHSRHRAGIRHTRRSRQPDTARERFTVFALPLLERTNPQAQAAEVVRLQNAIQTFALHPRDVAPAGFFGWLMGRNWRKLVERPSTGMPLDEDSLMKACVWSPWRHDAP